MYGTAARRTGPGAGQIDRELQGNLENSTLHRPIIVGAAVTIPKVVESIPWPTARITITPSDPSVETPGYPLGKTDEERSDDMVHVFIMGPPETLLLQKGVSPIAPQPHRPIWLWPSAANRLSRWAG